jgi:hypothetical protein
MTGSKRVDHWTSETVYECSEIAGSPRYAQNLIEFYYPLPYVASMFPLFLNGTYSPHLAMLNASTDHSKFFFSSGGIITTTQIMFVCAFVNCPMSLHHNLAMGKNAVGRAKQNYVMPVNFSHLCKLG